MCCQVWIFVVLLVPFQRILQLQIQTRTRSCSRLCMPELFGSGIPQLLWFFTASAWFGQLLSSSSVSIRRVWHPIHFFTLYCLNTSSVLIIMGVVAARMHSASLDVVRNALAIFIFISLCTLMYFCSLCSYRIASFQTGVPYSRRDKSLLYIWSSRLHVLDTMLYLPIWIICELVLCIFQQRSLYVHWIWICCLKLCLNISM